MSSRLDRITSNPDVFGEGHASGGCESAFATSSTCFASGASRAEILIDYPYLEDEDIAAAIEYAAQTSDHPIIRLG